MSNALAKCELLQDLSASEREALSELLEERRLEEGQAVYRSGDEGDALYIVAQGAVRLSSRAGPLALLQPGQAFGGGSLVVLGPRECDAIAEGSTRILTLTRESYMRLRSDEPQIALALQESLLRDFAGSVRASLPAVIRAEQG